MLISYSLIFAIEYNSMASYKNNVKAIIEKYFKPNTLAYEFYSIHCKKVTTKAFEIADFNKNLSIHSETLYQSAMLHDIGICMVNAPDIGCNGNLPYLAHGYKGREILEKEGLNNIAAVCERHVGVGISKKEIIELNLELPHRDMIPVTDIEKLVCLADKFYSKSANSLKIEKSYEAIRMNLMKYGNDHLEKFNDLLKYFNMF